eukprot:366450-Chlamydomonas_euryale.AAC.3
MHGSRDGAPTRPTECVMQRKRHTCPRDLLVASSRRRVWLISVGRAAVLAGHYGRAPVTGASDNASAAAGSFGRRDIGLNDAGAEKAAADKAAADKAAADKAAEESAVAKKAAAEKAAADQAAEKEDSPDDGGLSAIDLEYRPTK